VNSHSLMQCVWQQNGKRTTSQKPMSEVANERRETKRRVAASRQTCRLRNSGVNANQAVD
jgi:hypothetical protein